MIRASGSVTLGSSRKSPCHEAPSASSSDWAFRPFGRIQTLFVVDKSCAQVEQVGRSGAKARALITSNGAGAEALDAATGRISTATPSDFSGAPEEVGAQPALFDQGDRPRVEQRRRSGPESRRRCRDRPSLPRGDGAKAGVGRNRRYGAARAARACALETRFWRSFSSRSKAAKASSRSIVSRGTSKRARPRRGLRPRPSGRLAAGVDEDRRQRRGRDAAHPSGRPKRGRAAPLTAARPSRWTGRECRRNRDPAGCARLHRRAAGRSRLLAGDIRRVAMILDRLLQDIRLGCRELGRERDQRRRHRSRGSEADRPGWSATLAPVPIGPASMQARLSAAAGLEMPPPLRRHAAGGDRRRRQPRGGIVGAQPQPIFGARGQHPIGLGDALQHQVVDHHADIGIGAVEQDRRGRPRPRPRRSARRPAPAPPPPHSRWCR